MPHPVVAQESVDRFRARIGPFLEDWRSLDVRVFATRTGDFWFCEGLRATLMHDRLEDVRPERALPGGERAALIGEVWATDRLGDLLDGIVQGRLRIAGRDIRVGRLDSPQTVSPPTSLWDRWEDREDARGTFGVDALTFALTNEERTSRLRDIYREIDAELRAADPPWDGAAEVRRGYLRWGRAGYSDAFVEVLAPILLRIESCVLKGGKLRAEVRGHRLLRAGRTSASLVVWRRGGLVVRRTIPIANRSRTRTRGPLASRGIEVSVPRDAERAALFLLYRGIDVDRAVAVSPEAAHPYAVYNALVRGGVAGLATRLRESEGTAFEREVATLLHVLGFSAAHYGTESAAPDVVAFAPARGGPILVVECTSGVTDLTGKMSKVAMRAKQIRDIAGGREAISVLATSLSGAVLNETNRSQAGTDRIALVASDEIARLLELAKTGAEVTETLAFIRGLVPAAGYGK